MDIEKIGLENATRLLTLLEVPFPEFFRLGKWVDLGFRGDRRNSYSRIIDPLELFPAAGNKLAINDYARLLEILFSLPNADQLYARWPEGRAKPYRWEMDEELKNQIACLLFHNPQKCNFLQIHLKPNPDSLDRISIWFMEYQDKLVSYNIKFPYSLRGFFTLQTTEEYQIHESFWKPYSES